MGVADRLTGLVGQEVLLGHIGDIAVLIVLSQEVIEGLVLAWAHLFGDGVPPFLGIVELRIDIKDYASEGEYPVLDHLADRKFCKS
jgi:hypothetical protein